MISESRDPIPVRRAGFQMGIARWGRGMPILKICTSPGHLAAAPLASAAVSATMLFPNDETRRQQFYAVNAVGLCKQMGAPTEIPWEVVSALHDAADYCR